MCRILTALICIIITVGINEAWPQLPILVDEDVTELTRLAEEFWSLKPTIFQNEGPLVLCQVIDQCCAAKDRLPAISFMASSIVNEHRRKNAYATVLNACMNSTALKEVNESCPLLHKLISPSITKEDKINILQYKRIIMEYFTELNKLVNHLYNSCNGEEIHAFLCSSNTALVKTCVSRILQEICDDDGYEVYEKFIVENKQTLIDVNAELVQRSVENSD